MGAAGYQRSSVVGVTVVFVVSGFLMANWLARLPAVRDALHVTPGRLGVIMLSLSVGSVLALPLSGPVVHRWSPAPTVLGCAMLSTGAMVLVGVAGTGRLGGVSTLVPALFAYGVGVGMWDVAMNVEGAEVERRVERAIMPWFHAGFSLGTVAGALTGAAAAALQVALSVHLAVAAGISLVAIVIATRYFLPVPEAEAGHASAGSGALAAWREPRTVLVGLMMLGMALAEGSANDWLALAMVDGHGVDNATGKPGGRSSR